MALLRGRLRELAAVVKKTPVIGRGVLGLLQRLAVASTSLSSVASTGRQREPRLWRVPRSWPGGPHSKGCSLTPHVRLTRPLRGRLRWIFFAERLDEAVRYLLRQPDRRHHIAEPLLSAERVQPGVNLDKSQPGAQIGRAHV